MKIEEVIKQLERLIDDREAFVRAYAPDRNVFVRDKEALEEAMKVLKQYNRLVQVKARPAETHVKVQYEEEELTIKELVDRLHKYKFLFRFWKEEADKSSKMVDELMKQLSDAQTVRHGRWIAEDEDYEDSIYICSACGYEFVITDGNLESNEPNYCPKCGAKMDGGKDDG